MAFKLPPSVYSPTLVESVIYETGQYLEWYREAKVHTKVGVAAEAEPSVAAETVQTIEAWFEGKKPTLSGLEELQTHLRQLKLPIAHITLPSLPNHAQRAQLVDWFRAQASPDMLVAFTADRTMGGGIVVRTPNHIYDESWKQRLTAGRARLAEIIHAV